MVDYADRMNEIKASAIRELLALTKRPEIISFAGGLPAPDLFPVADLKKATDAVFDEAGKTILQYGETAGWAELRKHITDRMLKRNQIITAPDNIILTAGSQQGLDFIGKLFLNEGDVVLMESPSYLGAINAVKPYLPNFVEVPTDSDGLIVEELERILQTTDRVKLIYVIPDFQNPSGRTWPLERRKKFMEVITKYEIPVIEDNPYGDLRFYGEFLPALKTMDTKGLVMYLGTFSKILSPGMRIGWICANNAYIDKLNLIAQGAVLQTATFTAAIVSKYLDMFNVDEHIARILPVYKHSCDIMISTMDECFPEEAVFTRPDGGLFTWVELPDYIDTKVMASQAMDRKVAYVPGEGFFPNGGNNHCMRLNYSKEPDDRIVEGIRILGEVIKNNLR